MSAHPAVRADDVDSGEFLDADTSAAILRWMETALVPDGVDPANWEEWLDGGCMGPIEANGVPLTPEMLGRWARDGVLQ